MHTYTPLIAAVVQLASVIYFDRLWRRTGVSKCQARYLGVEVDGILNHYGRINHGHVMCVSSNTLMCKVVSRPSWFDFPTSRTKHYSVIWSALTRQ